MNELIFAGVWLYEIKASVNLTPYPPSLRGNGGFNPEAGN
jgi:hypothetical protein